VSVAEETFLTTAGRSHLVVIGRAGGRCLDWESQLCARRQQDADVGKWWSYPDGSELQDHLWSSQHWQRVAGDRVEKWNGIHE